MTAEVTVMNRQAIALAADSAVTVTTGRGSSKAWPTATKIFAMPAPHNVAVMIYGNTGFHRVPWDTILKQFRDSLPAEGLRRLQDYTTSILRFLRARPVLRPPEEQELFVFTKLVLEFQDLRRDLEESIAQGIAASPASSLTPTQQTSIINSQLEAWKRALGQADRLPRLPRDYRRRFSARYREQVRAARRVVFQQLPLTSGQSRRLSTIANLMFERLWLMEGHSGVVVAGYGRDDLFPSFEELRIEGFALDYLLHARARVQSITRKSRAGIFAFAQADDVTAFMEGVLPAYTNRLEHVLHERIVDLPLGLIDQMPGSSKQLAKLRENASEFTHNVYLETLDDLAKFRRERFVEPVLNVVAALPIEDLAVMAETLVSLASFRQKVSMSVETVGGPIDVAVISKGDGFVWIKRKNYFQLDQNPRVLAKYFR
jgi:hypothetical protein